MHMYTVFTSHIGFYRGVEYPAMYRFKHQTVGILLLGYRN